MTIRKGEGGVQTRTEEITRYSKPEDGELLRCAMTNQARTHQEVLPPNVHCKTS